MNNNVLILGGVAALLVYFSKTVTGAVGGALAGYGPDGALSVDDVAALANRAAARFPGVEARVLMAIAKIESSWRPTAFRLEPHIGDASAGLMQTLGKTAAWLWDIGNRDFDKPSLDDLLNPEVSMYFGAAYVNWLRNYGGAGHDLEWIVRAYNGGPGGAEKSYTEAYWAKFQAAYEGL